MSAKSKPTTTPRRRLLALVAIVGLLVLFQQAAPTVAQEPPTGSLTINKITGDRQPLAGAGFTLYDTERQTVVAPEAISGDDGVVAFEGLPFGTYCLVETTVPAGYLPVHAPDACIVVTIDEFMPDVTEEVMNFQGQQQLGLITVTKTDETGQPLPGVGFSLYHSDCATPARDQLVTDAGGQIVFADLPFAAYCLVETAPPNGYRALDPVTVMIDETTRAASVTLTNELLPAVGSITVLKALQLIGHPADEPLIPMEGVGFTLFDATCATSASAELFTDAEGAVAFTDLAPATYCVVETSPPEGFAPMEPETITVTAAEPDWELSVVNEPAEFGIFVLKADCPAATSELDVFGIEEEPPIDLAACQPGVATFELEGGSLASTQTVNVDGVQFVDLTPGEYAIREVTPAALGPLDFTLEPGQPLVILAVNAVTQRPDSPSPSAEPSVAPGTATPRGAVLPNTAMPGPALPIPAAILVAAALLVVPVLGRPRRGSRG
ncbi:MAG TPA: SpaA isopeptide-forming pilin-related protein [Candidatus Limnocylindria bacterium]|nr:SpaA isopeptide-forming pilin-related protein [Candidatus Limnocylindria bacterium]